MKYLFIVAAYLFGSIPTGYLLVRWTGRKDVRDFGSRSTGATNVLRVGGWKSALPVAVFDVLKGFLPVFLALRLFDEPRLAAVCGLAAVVGHCYPFAIGFRGGKGVATALGAFAGDRVVALPGLPRAFPGRRRDDPHRFAGLDPGFPGFPGGVPGRGRTGRCRGRRARDRGPDRLPAPGQHRPARQRHGEEARGEGDMKTAVVGGGSWGSAFARYLGSIGHPTRLWIREPDIFREALKTRENATFLPGFELPGHRRLLGRSPGDGLLRRGRLHRRPVPVLPGRLRPHCPRPATGTRPSSA